MYLFVILTCLLIDKAVFSRGYISEKCCDAGEYLNKIDSTYQCTENLSKRLDVLSNSTNFLKTYSEGECIDVSTTFSVFQVSGGKIIGSSPVEEKHFPKCCPLNYFYNSVAHSCVEDRNTTQSFIRETFIKVGLPNCKLIVDYQLNDKINIYDDIIDMKRNTDYCIDENEKGLFTLRDCQEDIQICNHVKCIKKCCPDGQSFVNGSHCIDTYKHGLNLSFSNKHSLIENPEEPFAVISNRTCKRIYLMDERRYIFKIDKNGIFKYWFNFTNSFVSEHIDYQDSYCVEHSSKKGLEGFFFFKCYPEKEYKQKFEFTVIPKILSCVFLALTVLIYLFLNEIRNLFGKILMNYCVATLLLFSLLVYAQVELAPTDMTCKLTAYSIIFFSTVSFAWLNIMCCDIWWTFGTTKQSVGIHQRKKDLKRLLLYLLYGWGMPSLLTLIIFLLSRSAILPYSIRPFVGTNICFIENRSGNYASILFLRLPHLIIQIVNTTLFFKTVIYCLRIKNEINKINDTAKHEKSNNFKRDKERLFLIVKLSVIMGVSFIFDVMSSFYDMSKLGTVPKYIEVVWDCINCLQGVFIFIIFIFKKKIYYDFLRKINVSRARTVFSNTQSITSTTRLSVLNSNRKSSRIK